MPRPCIPRFSKGRASVRGFRPLGMPPRGHGCVVLAEDELEAMRLADVEGLYQEEAAQRMGVSRATYGRVLARGRASVAKALCEGLTLLIGSGPIVQAPPRPDRCPVHGGPRRRGRNCWCPHSGEVETEEQSGSKGPGAGS